MFVCVWGGGGLPEDKTHYWSKMVKSRFFLHHVCGLSHFEDLIIFEKVFSVYPALDMFLPISNFITTCQLTLIRVLVDC